jgi:hypothetical protein
MLGGIALTVFGGQIIAPLAQLSVFCPGLQELSTGQELSKRSDKSEG